MLDFNHLNLCRRTLSASLKHLQRPDFKIRLPKPLGCFKQLAGTHFHSQPEIFFQIGGRTEFRFPHEKINLFAGEALVVPRGLPHNEITHKWRSDFKTLVIYFFPHEGIYTHTAVENAKGTSDIIVSEFFKTRQGALIAQHLNDMSELLTGEGSRGDTELEYAIRGLFQTAMAKLLIIIKQPPVPTDKAISPKIRECRYFIMRHLYDPNLSVTTIADHLHCSPDYLSHLFSTETGQHLTEYIQQERMTLAKQNLGDLSLSIKEIAWSCGYSDPSYFTQVFKGLLGETPRAFRKKLNP